MHRRQRNLVEPDNRFFTYNKKKIIVNRKAQGAALGTIIRNLKPLKNFKIHNFTDLMPLL